jgi:transposase InsO family protein
MKYRFIQDHKHQYRLFKLCRVLRIARTSYHRWLHRIPGKREQENQMLLDEIKTVHEKSRKTYGSPRITDKLREKGYTCSRPRVARLMRKHNIRAKTKRKFKVTTQSNHKYPISPDLVNQNFSATAPNKLWTSDITYIRTRQGWLYLTVILDVFNRQIVGWSMSNGLKANETTLPALRDAYSRKRPEPGLIFHSDRGVQYACHDFRRLLKKYKMTQSMSGKGNCYDNAITESFIKTLKTELIYFENYQTRKQAKSSIFEYIEIFYNKERKHSSLGNKTPDEYLKLNKAA